MITSFVYTAGIPTGDAGTKGHGTTKRVYVITGDKSLFKTMNSKRAIVAVQYIGTARFDYGLIRGRSSRLVKQARALAEKLNLERIKYETQE